MTRLRAASVPGAKRQTKLMIVDDFILICSTNFLDALVLNLTDEIGAK